jgi:hypothetical protein
MKYRNFRLFVQLLLAIVVLPAATALPLMLVWEFGISEFLFYWESYPHLTVYPAKFLWAAGICLILAWSFVPFSRRRKRDLVAVLLVAIAFATIVVFAEERGDKMMILEFNAATRDAYCMKELVQVTAGSAPPVCAHVAVEEPISWQAGNDVLFSRNYWTRTHGSLWQVTSYSRLAYLYTVWAMIFLIIVAFSMIRFTPPRLFSKIPQLRYGSLHIIGVVILVAWIPFRGFYNATIKAQLFSPDYGLAADLPSVGAPEVILMFLFVIFLLYAWFRVFEIDDRFLSYVVQVLPIAAFAALLRFPETAGTLFGFKPFSHVVVAGWVVLVIFLIWFPFINLRRR